MDLLSSQIRTLQRKEYYYFVSTIISIHWLCCFAAVLF